MKELCNRHLILKTLMVANSTEIYPLIMVSDKYPNNISFVLNTDGVPIFKSSKTSIWPIYLMINELLNKDRVQHDNMITCGLWHECNIPFMAAFTLPLYKGFKF